MAKTTVTEESLGLGPTDEEISTSVATAGEADDDISLSDDEPEQQPIPERQPEAAPVAEEEPKTVDLRALQETRAELRETKQRAAILEQRWNDFLAGQQQNAPKPEAPAKPTIPDANDPVGRVNYVTEKLLEIERREQETAAQAAERQQQETWYNQAFDHVDAQYTAAIPANPELPAAYAALRESIAKELLAYGLSDADAARQFQQREREHIAYIAQNGIDPAKYIMGLAQARGWRPGQPKPAPQPGKQDLGKIAETQQRHQSLSDAPGGEAIAPLDAKALARMTDKDFKVWMSKKGNEAKFDEMMGKS